ncbi:MAG: DUF5615 family PIN-like protein [Nitrospinae bacterium]|nr:DUF5615 family PIN-like protein [Nitrospinota bacterium]
MSVRLLVNENFPAPSVARLRAMGWDVLSVAEGRAGMNDIAVIALPVSEKRLLVTFDRDYGELLFARGLPPPPAAILLRVPSYRPGDPAAWLTRIAQKPETLFGMFTVFDGTAIRSRSLLGGSAK